MGYRRTDHGFAITLHKGPELYVQALCTFFEGTPRETHVIEVKSGNNSLEIAVTPTGRLKVHQKGGRVAKGTKKNIKEDILVNGLIFKYVGENGDYSYYRAKKGVSLWSNQKATRWCVVDPVEGRFSEKLLWEKTPEAVLKKAFLKLTLKWDKTAAQYGYVLSKINFKLENVKKKKGK